MMASWFEKAIGRPVKDFLRGSRAVQMDQAKADQEKLQIELGLASGKAMAANLKEINKSISQLQEEGKVKDLADVQDMANEPVIDIDTDYGKRYLILIIAVVIIFFLVKK